MGLSPEFASMNEGIKAEGLRRILKIGLMGLGAGVGSAGLIHLIKKMNQRKTPSYQVPTDIDIPVPTMKMGFTLDHVAGAGRTLSALAAKGAIKGVDDPKSGPVAGALKGVAHELPHAPLSMLGALYGGEGMRRIPTKSPGLSKLLGLLGEIGGGTAGYFGSRQVGNVLSKQSDWASSLVSNLMPTPAGESPPSVFSPGWLRGDTQTSTGGMPWMYPAAAAVGAGTLTGGHALVNWLMKKHRKNVLKSDLAKAQKEYDDAMLGQYEKKSSAKKTYTLDDVAAMMEKQGISLNDLLGRGLGLYGAGAGALAGVSGYGAYKWLKGRSQDQLLEKALKQRALIRALSHPPDIYVHPVSVSQKKHEHGTADELQSEEQRELL